MKIMANDFKRQWDDIGAQCLKVFEQVASSGWYILGQEVKDFEDQLARISNTPHAIGVSSGLSALEIALRALKLRPQEKVLTTAMSAFATTLAILNEGGTPVYVDVDHNGNMDLDLAEEILKKEKIRFMIPVHLYGNPVDLVKLQELKKRYDLLIIEDAAQAIGASFNQQFIGSVGDFTGLSFYPTKNLGAFGDAGALLTGDQQLSEMAHSLRDYGQTQKYVHQHIGYNARLDEVHAAILHKTLLPKLEWSTQKRREIASLYSQTFIDKVKILKPLPQAQPVWHLYPLFLENKLQRDEVMEKLKAQGIGVNIHYPKALHQQPCLQQREWIQATPLLQTEKIAQTELSLPIHPYMTDEEVQFVIQETLACL